MFDDVVSVVVLFVVMLFMFMLGARDRSGVL
jgi:hypothetical protein